MMKELIILIFVTIMHHSVDGLANDAQSNADACFIRECRITFFGRISHYPLCGSDQKPYIHHFSFDCAQRCAKEYGLELTVAHEGYCRGKPPGMVYWANILKF
ncbi:hypothetical protein WA026_023034 [Henosepilachna vigintioctopunctata]|uniref:Kazal-like domain-containing protein n=1 Tax=Henosepilachna vigintioctopunctata TaxID=420089 RepID=A0AAW1VBC9_9CUCU